MSTTDQSDLADHNYTSFGDYTSHWLSLQDRGRLFKVNDQTYDFFVELEKSVRPLLNEKLATTRKGAEDDLSSTILRTSEVCKCWQKISSSYVRGSESDELLAAIFSLWISIRGFEFASSMLETYKRERQLLVKR